MPASRDYEKINEANWDERAAAVSYTTPVSYTQRSI